MLYISAKVVLFNLHFFIKLSFLNTLVRNKPVRCFTYNCERASLQHITPPKNLNAYVCMFLEFSEQLHFFRLMTTSKQQTETSFTTSINPRHKFRSKCTDSSANKNLLFCLQRRKKNSVISDGFQTIRHVFSTE